jgi:hypothetical protein
MVSLLVALAACSGTHRPRDKERDAVRLLGMANMSSGGDIEMSTECARSGASESEERAAAMERANALREIVNSWLRPDDARDFQGPNIGDSLHAAAKRIASLAKGCRRMYLDIPTAGYPDTAAIFAILGADDSSRRGTVLLDSVTSASIPMSSHYYGWLTFTALGGKVAHLGVDFKTSGY